MTRVWIATALALLAAGAVLWLLWSESSDPAPVLDAPGAPTRTEPADAITAAAPLAQPEAAERQAVATEPDPSPSATDDSDEPADEITLRGTFVVTDEDGVEHRDENGELQLNLWDGQISTTGTKVEVEAGSWSIRVQRPNAVSVSRVRLGDQVVQCEFKRIDLPNPLPADYTLDLTGRWLASLHLRVLGDDTGADLSGVRVLAVNDWRIDSFGHPGNGAVHVVVDHANSPVRFKPEKNEVWKSESKFWVHASGYAWAPIRLSLTDKSERVIRLVRGGDLAITVHGAEPPSGSVLRLRPTENGVPHAQLTVAERGATRVEGLTPGRYVAQVEKGEWFQEPMVLGSTACEVVAGETGLVSIAVAQAAEPEGVTVAGVLELPAVWSADDLMLEFEPSGEAAGWGQETVRIRRTEMDAAGERMFAWSAGPMRVGQYQLTVVPCELRTVVQIPPGGNSNLQIDIPPPAEVHLRIVDSRNGQLAGVTKASWAGVPERWNGGWTHREIQPDEDGVFRFTATPPRIMIHSNSETYGFFHEPHEVHPGINDLVIEVSPPCGVEISLVDGEATLPWDWKWEISLEQIDGDGNVAYMSGNRMTVTAPGRYRLALKGVRGYEDVPDREVTIGSGEWVDVEIPLVRVK